MRDARSPRSRALRTGAITALTAVGLLTGCTATPSPSPSPTDTPSTSPSPSPSAAPSLVPDGSAEENQAFFDQTNSAFLAGNAMPGGRPIIDNLIAAGFDRAAMQVTPDQTSIGGAVDSVQFSVRFDDECLIGQTSGAAGYVGDIGPTIDGTSCLAGATRPIDW